MSKKISILQISPQFPFPEDDGGRIGIAGIYKALSRSGNNISIAAFCNSNIKKQYFDFAKSFGNIHLINHSTKNSKLRIIKSVFNNESLNFNKFFSKKVIKQLETLVETGQFDIIECEHSYTAKLGLHLSTKYKIPYSVRLHNIEWMIWHRYADTFSKYDPRKLYINRQSKLVKQDEKLAIENANICFTITDIDKQRAQELAPKGKYITIPPGVDISNLQPNRAINKKPFSMVIASNYKWVHNVDGIRWFIEKVLPIVRKYIPQAELNIIGKNPPKWFSNYKKLGVNVIGYVEDVKTFLSESCVYIAPLFVGSGIRIKILEALAMELPVVATKVSAEGINGNYSNGVYVTDDITDFATAIIDLLNNPNTAIKIGETGRNYIAKNFNWDSSIELILKEYRKILKL